MDSIEKLKRFAIEIRVQTLKCLRNRGFGHVGGCLSVVETLAVLYDGVMKYDPKNPQWDGRDYFIMSKGHAGPVLFATLALKGFFPVDWLNTLCEPNTKLPSHCDRLKTPGVDVSTGSLGQGLSIGAGLAQGFKTRRKDNQVYVMLGDGECAEGQIWEAAQYASHYNLDNLTAFIDWNKRQVDGYVEDILKPGDLTKKFEAFGWQVQVVAGADVRAIQDTIANSKSQRGNRPSAIILDGIKGSGVPEYEKMFDNHFFALDQSQADLAIRELEKQLA